jgi:DNA-binding transcriptional ArsR family regulator
MDAPELGLDQLKALTHPLRVRILKELRTNGAATATLLATRLGESSGATSYHLRQLARHGFVEDDADSGDGRERWWRPAFRGHRVDASRWLDDDEQRGVLALYESSVAAAHAETTREFVETQDEWPREWVEEVVLSDYKLRLTPVQLRRLAETLHKTIERYERYDSPGAAEVSVILHAFPRRTRPFAEESP